MTFGCFDDAPEVFVFCAQDYWWDSWIEHTPEQQQQNQWVTYLQAQQAAQQAQFQVLLNQQQQNLANLYNNTLGGLGAQPTTGGGLTFGQMWATNQNLPGNFVAQPTPPDPRWADALLDLLGRGRR